MALYQYGSSSKAAPPRTGKTEFEILKESHRFLREDDAGAQRTQSWDEQLAGKYYDSLYREFAVCDLKHYKSGNFALRWRTEDEVLAGNGETTCGNTRCRYHHPRPGGACEPALTTLELPFAYEERGEAKGALVKVVLCTKCVDKLMWKRRKEKEGERPREREHRKDEEEGGSRADAKRARSRDGDGERITERRRRERPKERDAGEEEDLESSGKSHRNRQRSTGRDEERPRRRASRSRSPKQNKRARFS